MRESIKGQLLDFRSDVNKALSNKTFVRIISVILALVLVFVMTAGAFATSNIVEAVENTGKKIWDDLASISIPVGVVALVITGIFLLLKHGEKDIDKLKTAVIYIALGYGIIFVAPLVIKTFVDMFKGVGNEAWDELTNTPTTTTP